MRSFSVITAAFVTGSLCYAGTLVGIAVDPNSPIGTQGLVYRIDPITGATTPMAGNYFWLVAGDSPYPATIFGSSPINLYTANFDTGGGGLYYSGGVAFDLAFDSDHNTLYSIVDSSLRTIPLTPCSGPCPTIPVIGSLSAPIYAMGYVPGEGLYGVDAVTGMLYRIDGNTAALTPVGPLGPEFMGTGLSITDIEFDVATGRMIATAGFGEPVPVGPPGRLPLVSGKIYLLDRYTGGVTLLNDNAPNFISLAEVSPEPVSLILLGTGLLALCVRWRAQRK